jgi:hypothetical protein
MYIKLQCTNHGIIVWRQISDSNTRGQQDVQKRVYLHTFDVHQMNLPAVCECAAGFSRRQCLSKRNDSRNRQHPVRPEPGLPADPSTITMVSDRCASCKHGLGRVFRCKTAIILTVVSEYPSSARGDQGPYILESFNPKEDKDLTKMR